MDLIPHEASPTAIVVMFWDITLIMETSKATYMYTLAKTISSLCKKGSVILLKSMIQETTASVAGLVKAIIVEF